jgi:sugar lactone lactonase YvrE
MAILIDKLSTPLALVMALASITCQKAESAQAASHDIPDRAQIEVVASSAERQWTGVAVSKKGRIFVNYPKWIPGDRFGISVAELIDSQAVAYPDDEWNGYWQPATSKSPQTQFVAVQAVYIDARDRLWVIDTGNPNFEGLVPGATKLVRINLETNEVEKIISIPTGIVIPGSYTNDIRVDVDAQAAYLTDSERPALIVVTDIDCNTQNFRRVLQDDPSTSAEDIDIVIDNQRWRPQDPETRPQVHADGIALHPSKRYVCYQALTGTRLYCIATEHLRDFTLNDAELGELVIPIGKVGPADGLFFDHDARLYHSSLELNAVRRLRLPESLLDQLSTGTKGFYPKIEVWARHSELLSWPDSFSGGPQGGIFVTASRIHQNTGPYYVLRLSE